MRTAAAMLAALVLVSSGCDKDKPKPDDTKKAEATPIPSDMVFNDFVPENGGPKGLKARGDGGIEGGISDVQGSPADDTTDPPAAAGDATKLKVTDAGADPKAARRYIFTAGKVEKRVLTIVQSGSETRNGQPTPPQEITLKISLDLTTKVAKKDGATIELKVTKLDIPGLPASAAPMLASASGITGQFDVSSQGEAGELQVAMDPKQRNQLVENVLQALSQASQLLIAPLPDSPIGAGAKWELPKQPGDQDQGAKRFTATDLGADGGTVVADIEMKVPKKMERQQGITASREAEGKGKYTYTVKWNGIAPRVEGDLQIAEKIEGSAGQGQPMQSMVRLSKSHQLIESAK